MQLAENLGLEATINEFAELNAESLAKGIGRKATDGELIAYLSKVSNAEPSS